MSNFLFSVYLIMVTFVHHFTNADRYLCRCEKFAYQNKPFVAIWNSPTNGCDFNFSLPVNLKQFGILENDHQTWDGKYVTVFASAQLGLYPYFVANGAKNFNGGLPQLVDLGDHLRKARRDIEAKIPDPNYSGLAVIDWEQWRPLWDTNWAPKKIYKVKSVDLVRQRHPHWTLGRILEEAKREFEEAARALFEHTITLGKELRPKAFWGFYGFPDCYGNEDFHYQCIEKTKKQNDQLEWLFSASSALFPSMYLLKQKPGNHDFVLGRLRETLRFASKGFGANKRNIPIFVYHRNIYDEDARAFNFLQKADLDNTIDVSAKLGTAGIVIWGNRFDENTSPEICRKIGKYVHNVLGPYLLSKFHEVHSCAAKGCHNQGHCIDKTLLTPQLIKQYQTLNSSCATTKLPTKPLKLTRLEQFNHKEIEADVASPLLKTLRDRNHGTNNAFQSTQPVMSKEMNEFFDQVGLRKNTIDNKNADIMKKNVILHNKKNIPTINVKKSEISRVSPESNSKHKLEIANSKKAQMSAALHADESKTLAAVSAKKQLLSSRMNTSTIPKIQSQSSTSRHANVYKSSVPSTKTTEGLVHHTVNKSKAMIQEQTSGAGQLGDTRANESRFATSSELYKNQKNEVPDRKSEKSSEKKSEVPVPHEDPNHPSPTLDIETENEDDARSSLAVIGQALKMEKSPGGVGTSVFNVKNSSTAEKARRKSEIALAKLNPLWGLMDGKIKSKSWIPRMYIILIGTLLAGVLMLFLMSVGVFYSVTLRHFFQKKKDDENVDDDETKTTLPTGHSSPLKSPTKSKDCVALKIMEIKDFFNRKQNTFVNDIDTPEKDEVDGNNPEDREPMSSSSNVGEVHVLADSETIKIPTDSQTLEIPQEEEISEIARETGSSDNSRRTETSELPASSEIYADEYMSANSTVGDTFENRTDIENDCSQFTFLEASSPIDEQPTQLQPESEQAAFDAAEKEILSISEPIRSVSHNSSMQHNTVKTKSGDENQLVQSPFNIKTIDCSPKKKKLLPERGEVHFDNKHFQTSSESKNIREKTSTCIPIYRKGDKKVKSTKPLPCFDNSIKIPKTKNMIDSRGKQKVNNPIESRKIPIPIDSRKVTPQKSTRRKIPEHVREIKQHNERLKRVSSSCSDRSDASVDSSNDSRHQDNTYRNKSKENNGLVSASNAGRRKTGIPTKVSKENQADKTRLNLSQNQSEGDIRNKHSFEHVNEQIEKIHHMKTSLNVKSAIDDTYLSMDKQKQARKMNLSWSGPDRAKHEKEKSRRVGWSDGSHSEIEIDLNELR